MIFYILHMISSEVQCYRECDSYKDEMKFCGSMSGRFHQFYVHGKVCRKVYWLCNVRRYILSLDINITLQTYLYKIIFQWTRIVIF